MSGVDRKRSVRGSVRSRGSSSASSGVAASPRERLKDCCRLVVSFMFTQVGVGGLVVSYAFMGAIAFKTIEGKDTNDTNIRVTNMRSAYVTRLWNVTDHLNVLHKDRWYFDVRQLLIEYQHEMAMAIEKGYDARTNEERWTFPSALMFSLSVFTMIGFGHLVPRTNWGKIATMLYAVFGIPVYVLYFMNMGQVLASCFKWFYCKIVRCASEKRDKPPHGKDPAVTASLGEVKQQQLQGRPLAKAQFQTAVESSNSSTGSSGSEEEIIVPSTACLWVMMLYLLTGTVMFAEWEQWDYLDACYFCVTSLCKIGMGDFVPGNNPLAAGDQTKLIINFVYLLVGMGVMAMCYNLMKEEVRVRLRDFKSDMLDKLQDVGVRMRD